MLPITALKTQIESTKAYIQWNSVHGYYITHMEYEKQLEVEERDLSMWEDRLVEGQVDFLDWAATHSLCRRLPQEILDTMKEILNAPSWMDLKIIV